MRIFNIKEAVLNLPEERLNATVAAIKRHQSVDAKAAALPNSVQLRNIANRSNAVSSCALGNVFLSEEEEVALFDASSEPKNFAEKMVRGYVEALEYIDQIYDQTELSISFISTLHYIMYKQYNPEIGGKFKDAQNYIQERLPDGTYRPVFTPSHPEEAYSLLDNLIWQFNECAKDPEIDKLLLIAVFMFDFLCIHPYNHGNGRVSRLVLHYLLKKYGYAVDDYYAVSYLLENQVADYLGSFMESGHNWDEGINNYRPYVHFLLRMVHAAYRRVEYIVAIAGDESELDDKLLRILRESNGPIGLGVFTKILYNDSRDDIKARLNALMDEGRIQRVVRGSKVKYFVN